MFSKDRAGRTTSSCEYYAGHAHLASTLPVAFDIEDMVKQGEVVRGCPVYAMRLLHEHADLVFLPYTYLIDPIIREAMQIPLKDNILVFDEAHNMEDCSREAASVEVTPNDFKTIVGGMGCTC